MLNTAGVTETHQQINILLITHKKNTTGRKVENK